MKNNLIWIIIGIILLIFIVPNLNLLSTVDFSRFGPTIEISDTDDPNFNVNDIVGGRVRITHPTCYPEDSSPQVKEVVINGKKVVSAGPSQTCEQQSFSTGTEFEDLTSSQKEDLLLSKTTDVIDFEIDSSFLKPFPSVSGADSITYIQKVECTNNNHCVDPIRRQAFVCDTLDYKCKTPNLVGTRISEDKVTTTAKEDAVNQITAIGKEKSFSKFIIPLIILLAIGAFIGGKKIGKK